MKYLLVVLAVLALACNSTSTVTLEPEPTPEPTPVPTAPPVVVNGTCQLEARPDHGNCSPQSPLFEEPMEASIEDAIRAHPEIFDLTRTRGCDRCFLVLNAPAYEALVVDGLKRRGFCAQCDEECGVKNTNAFNEQYDILLSNGYMRRAGSASYRATCFPAAF